MNQTVCPFKYVASWIICILIVGSAARIFGQTTFPPLTPVNVSGFIIPFEFTESADTIREVELLVSKDRGRRWYSVAKQPVSTKKFNFQADSNGEYWFVFRTTTLSGNISPLSGMPQLRVLVDTKNPLIVLPSQSSESGPLTPPKPMRFQEGTPQKPAQSIKPAQSEETSDNPVKADTEESIEPMLGPRLPGFDPAAISKDTDSDLLANLLSGMDPFLDIQPVAAKSIPNNPVTADKSNTVSNLSSNVPPGGISGIFLSNTAAKPQIVVKWNTGMESFRDAQIDVLRSGTKEGQRFPIAINLQNNGEYWWFLTQEDLKPFYITIRIRSIRSGIREDVTQTAITIDPQIFYQKSASVRH